MGASVKIKPIATGLASFLPGAYYLHARLLGRSKGQRVNPARYCYSVWLRHLVHAAENGLNTRPDTVAELGPGGSLGVGIAALITGASRYHGLEILNRTNIAGNLAVFSDLVEMFARREDIPADNEFPKIRPFLESYDFPHHILDDSRMQYALAEDRLVAIRNSIANMSSGGV